MSFQRSDLWQRYTELYFLPFRAEVAAPSDADFADTLEVEHAIVVSLKSIIQGVRFASNWRVPIATLFCTNRESRLCVTAAGAHLDSVLEDVERNCWLVEAEGRRYWEILSRGAAGLRIRADSEGGCPWRGGLYQVMRNWVLAQAMLDDGLAKSIDVAVCIHPENRSAARLARPVAGFDDVSHSMNALLGAGRIESIDPREVVQVLGEAGASDDWRKYMCERYVLPER